MTRKYSKDIFFSKPIENGNSTIVLASFLNDHSNGELENNPIGFISINDGEGQFVEFNENSQSRIKSSVLMNIVFLFLKKLAGN